MPPTPLVSIVILAILEEAPEAFYELDVVDQVVARIRASIAVEQSAIARPAREARDLMKNNHRYAEDPRVILG